MSLKRYKDVLIRSTLLLTALLFPSVSFAQLPPTGWAKGQQNAASSGLPYSSIYGIIANTMNWLLAVLGFIAIVGFVISGIMYLTAAGDEGRAETAKNGMMYSIIGVIVALMGYVIVRAVNLWLGAYNEF